MHRAKAAVAAFLLLGLLGAPALAQNKAVWLT